MTAQGSAYHRFRRALDRGNVTEALSAAAELQFVGLTEALELTLLLADGELAKYERAALRWHLRFVYESKNLDIRESQAVLILLAAIPANHWLRPRWRNSSVDGKASVSQYWGAVRLDGEAARSRRSDSGKRHVEDAS